MTEVAENVVKLAEKGSENPAVQTQNQSTVIFEMAQQNMVNGPSIDGNHLKNEINSQEAQQNKLPSEQTINPPSPQAGPFLTRPPLIRTDSRQNFQYRPPFPNTNQPSGPQSIGPQSLFGNQPNYPVNSGPQSIGPQILGGQQVRPQQGIRQPIVSPQFVQRGPPLGPGGTQGPRPVQSINSAPGGPFAQNPQQQRPIFRPQTPYPRPPLLGQRPNIYQQSSVPSFNRPRPNLEETLSRSLTLDSSELQNQKNAEANRSYSTDQRPPSAASLGRSFSVTTSNPSLDQKKISGSQESLNISRQNSLENMYKKEENVPSRPESRSASRMDKIIESEDKFQNKNRPESRGSEVTNGEIVTSRSPSKESPDHQNHNVLLNSPKQYDSIDSDLKKKELDLKLSSKSHKGDNDSGVDESTQGNDQSCNGEARSPRKPAKSRTSTTTPTTARSSSRGSKTPSSLQSPDSAATTPGSAEKKKVPMNKVQVGTAPSPNLKVVRSKIGSLDNAHYKPGGGKVKIESRKLDFKNAGSRIEAKNEKYAPKVGEKKELYSSRSVDICTSPRKVITQKLEWNAKSKIGSLDNAAYKPKGSEKKIESVKLDFKEKAKPKIGSKDNIKHQPGGGEVKIENRKIELHASSKVGSLDNVKHKPAGGDKKIFDDKDYLKNKSGKSSMDHSLSGSQHSVHSQEPKAPVADENLNQEH